MSAIIFRRLGLSLGLLCSLWVGCFAQVVDTSKESSLQKPISLKLKIAQLPDALKQISKLTGVKLTCIAPVSDLKVTVLVKDIPAGLVLAKIASALDCEWKADGDLFRLTMDSEEIKNRDRYVAAESLSAQKEITDALNGIAEATTVDPQVAADELSKTKKPDNERLAVLGFVQHSPDPSLGRFLANLSSQDVAAFWRGEVVGGIGAPSSLANQNTQVAVGEAGGGFGPRSNSIRMRVPPATLVQYDPLLYQVNVWQGGAMRHFHLRPMHLVTQFKPEGKLASMPFGKEVLDWDQPIPIQGDFKKVNLDSADPTFSNAANRFSVSDLLENVFDVTGVPIVADAFRVSSGLKTARHSAQSLTAWLENLKANAHVFTRFEDGIITVRHGGFWRLRTFETPEEKLAPIERKVANGVMLEDYANFVSKLSSEQARALSLPGEAVTKFDSRPIEQGLPALRFFASLGSQMIGQAQLEGASFREFDANQRQLYQTAALEGAFYGSVSPSFASYLLRLSSTGDFTGLGFLMRNTVTNLNGAAVDTQSLIFGVNQSQAATYGLEFRQ